MKADPISLIISENINTDLIFYFITGNEITLIEKIKEKIVQEFSKKYSTKINNVKDLKNTDDNMGLFSDKTINIVNSLNLIEDSLLTKVSLTGNNFIFLIENSPKSKKIKNIFINRNDSFVIECYELSKNDKVKLLNNWAKLNKLKLDESLFWFLVDKLSNKYIFFERDLEKIQELKEKELNVNNVNLIINQKKTGISKIFFEILNNNSELIKSYNNKIEDTNDVSEFYYTIKQFCVLIINSKNKEEFTRKIPLYLFREKGVFVNIFSKFNEDKKRGLINLLYKTEIRMRKSGNFSYLIGLRFLLSLRKLTIS